MRRGLFVGLVTLDLIYLCDAVVQPNQKVVATDATVAAGGPATNAAVTFCHLGSEAQLLGVLGKHSSTALIKADLEAFGVKLRDLDREYTANPSISSIIVTASTGERAIVSLNASKSQAQVGQIPDNILNQIDVVLIDGHQMVVGGAIAQQAKAAKIPVVMDGGSWKPGFEKVLPWVDYAICSANFYPPNCQTPTDVFSYLIAAGIPQIAITQGEKPILYYNQGNYGKIALPPIPAVDTLGAGDIFHGAFCHYILEQEFITALTSAAKIASFACQFFGTRSWMAQVT